VPNPALPRLSNCGKGDVPTQPYASRHGRCCRCPHRRRAQTPDYSRRRVSFHCLVTLACIPSLIRRILLDGTCGLEIVPPVAAAPGAGFFTIGRFITSRFAASNSCGIAVGRVSASPPFPDSLILAPRNGMTGVSLKKLRRFLALGFPCHSQKTAPSPGGVPNRTKPV